ERCPGPFRPLESLPVARPPLAQLNGQARSPREPGEKLLETFVSRRAPVRDPECLHPASGGGSPSLRERSRRSLQPAARWTRPRPETKPRKNPEWGRAAALAADHGRNSR